MEDVGSRTHPRWSTAGARVRVAATVLVLAGLTILWWRIRRHAGTNYDLEFHMAWGRELIDGHLPDFENPPSPTEHPLTILATALADLVPGVSQRAVMHASAYFAYAALIVVVLLIGAELFSWAAGVVAGAVIAVNPPMSITTASAYQDVTTAALVMFAVLLAIRRPRQAMAPLAVLGVAGLLRPEIWGLAVAYWLWQWRGRDTAERLRLGLVAVAAPVIWMVIDLALTGDPLYSLNVTRSHAESAGDTTGIANAPDQLIDNLRLSLGRVVLVGGALGAVAAGLLASRLGARVRRAGAPSSAVAIPLGALLLTGLAFLVLGSGSLPLYERFLFVPTSLVAVFFGFLVTSGWHLRPPLLGIAAGLAGVAVFWMATRYVDHQRERTRLDMSILRAEYRAIHGLERLVARRDAKGTLERCDSVVVTPYVARPVLANALGRAPKNVRLVGAGPISGKVALVVPGRRDVRDILRLKQGLPPAGRLAPTPAGFRVVAGNGLWRVLARDC